MKIKPDFTRLHSGENESRVLYFSLSEEYRNKSVKLCFVSPMGRLFMTDPLSHTDGQGSYSLPGSLLDGRGVLLCQLICFSDDGYLAKSPVLELPVFCSADDMSCPALSGEGLKSFAFIIEALESKTDRQEIIELLKGKSDTDHLHRGLYLTRDDLWEYLPTHPSAGYEHTHDGRYYTKPEADELIASHAADYVVEQGGADGWEYRKWSSGVAECWGQVAITVTNSMSSNGNYAGMNYEKAVVFPKGLFCPGSTVRASVLPIGPGYPSVVGGAPTNEAMDVSIRTEWAVADNTVWLHVQVFGRWKE